MLDTSINYIVSGIERSGTSMLMQILHNGGCPIGYDDERVPDENNPKGYYELEGGKIINSLIEGSFPFETFRGTVIKITAYGLKYLPPGNYKIIYSERNIEEILDSMEKMAQITDEDREETKQAFIRLNMMIKDMIQRRDDCQTLYLNYNEILRCPEQEIAKIPEFLGFADPDFPSMIRTVDTNLYRHRYPEEA